MKVDVIIPVYRPDQTFFRLIERLETQTMPVRRIIVMNTEEKYFTQLIYGTKFLEQHQQVKVCHLSKKEFDHGRTRAQGVTKSDAEIFVMMTQDAMPEDARLIENLTAALVSEYLRVIRLGYSQVKIAVKILSTGIIMGMNHSGIRRVGDPIARLHGPGCIQHILVENSMAGKTSQLFIDISQADHPEVFRAVPSEGEGIRSVKMTALFVSCSVLPYPRAALIPATSLRLLSCSQYSLFAVQASTSLRGNLL